MKDNPFQLPDGSEVPIYISDDLTKRRANLAFEARKLKRANHIQDTWITNCKIIVKDNYNRISLISSLQDLQKLNA